MARETPGPLTQAMWDTWWKFTYML